jgi:hypothetical protein
MNKYSEEIKILDNYLRIDVYSESPINYVFEDDIWLNYRLANAEIRKQPTKQKADLIWLKDIKEKNLLYNGETLFLFGEWYTGEIQRLIVVLAAKELEKNDIFPLHSTAFHYKNFNILLLSGEQNHGKTMTLIEALYRKAEMISGETTLVNYKGNILGGSRDLFLKTRPKGTERSDLPPDIGGWKKFFPNLPEIRMHSLSDRDAFDLVILPDIDGNFDTQVSKIEEFEKQLQIFVSITMSFFIPHHLISSGIPVPLVNDIKSQNKRADFAKNFSKNLDFYAIRGANPKIIMDEIENVIKGR